MRTTLTLEPDVARMIDEEVHRTRRPFKQVVNEALRRGLATAKPRKRAVAVTPHRARLQPGFDAAALNRLADELEDGSTIGKGGSK